MKRFHLTILVPASLLLLAGCSYSSLQSFGSPQDESASAQTISPINNYESARRLAWEAAVLVQKPPHPEETWQEARIRWRQAIRLLEAIPANTPISSQAKRKLADYRVKYQEIEQRLTNERTATDQFKQAQTIAWQAAVTVQNPPHSLKIWQRAREKWQHASQLAATVPPLTTVSKQAQAKVDVYRSNLKEIDRRLTQEQKLLDVAEQFSSASQRLYTLQNQVIAGRSAHSIGMDYSTYESLVRSLQKDLRAIEASPTMKSHPIYSDLKTALSDYEFALTIWQAYQRHRQANVGWLGNDDFFNQLIPVSLVNETKLLQRYNVKLHRGVREPKVPLKFAVWAIWEVASQHSRAAEQQVTKFY